MDTLTPSLPYLRLQGSTEVTEDLGRVSTECVVYVCLSQVAQPPCPDTRRVTVCLVSVVIVHTEGTGLVGPWGRVGGSLSPSSFGESEPVKRSPPFKEGLRPPLVVEVRPVHWFLTGLIRRCVTDKCPV